ncbi:MAG TPA: ATP-binding protein [Nitrososphaerales archaeon]|nr:ATP-binding protein [Nitrososphaerales archaeon]
MTISSSYALERNNAPAKPTPEIVVLVGIPGSGKSTLATTRFRNQVRINLDTLRSRHSERRKILQALSEGHSIVIDNTNTTMRARRRYIDIAWKFSLPIRAVCLICPLETALERNAQRRGREHVPDRAVRMYNRIMQIPVEEEGFDSVEILNSGGPYSA